VRLVERLLFRVGACKRRGRGARFLIEGIIAVGLGSGIGKLADTELEVALERLPFMVKK
jgi:hypothetical protein